jgi:hypothetical protein
MSTSIIDRVRRNHALEHASITVLSEKRKGFNVQGNSHPGGFNLNIYGDVPEEDVQAAVFEAQERLRKGESRLAVHPNCGTVLLTSATMAALAAQLSFSVEQRRQGRSRLTPSVLLYALPTAVLAVVLALILGKPVGMAVQARYTVDPNIGDMQVVAIRKTSSSLVTRFFQVVFGHSDDRNVQAYKIITKG